MLFMLSIACRGERKSGSGPICKRCTCIEGGGAFWNEQLKYIEMSLTVLLYLHENLTPLFTFVPPPPRCLQGAVFKSYYCSKWTFPMFSHQCLRIQK